MRKQIDGLAILVADIINLNPTSGEIFVFWNKGRNKLKILYWHINGFCLVYKRLEKQRFKLPEKFTEFLQITTKELRWLLEGLNFTQLKGHKQLSYKNFY